MTNPITKWFFELIEDAIGTKAMTQFQKEENETANLKTKSQDKEKA
mgnify:CR=1 FL=1